LERQNTHAKALTGVDDHSRFCVSARLMPRERTRPACDALAAALRIHGVPTQILTAVLKAILIWTNDLCDRP
jgi:hypothetical protein